MKINYVNDISVEDYNALRVAVGWAEVEKTQVKIGIDNSAFLIAAVSEGQTIGTARVISDGGYMALIVDIMVLPAFQGKGVGKELMGRCMDIRGNLTDGQSVFINLMAASGKEPFYAKFGFDTRPNENAGAGMTQYLCCCDGKVSKQAIRQEHDKD